MSTTAKRDMFSWKSNHGKTLKTRWPGCIKGLSLIINHYYLDKLTSWPSVINGKQDSKTQIYTTIISLHSSQLYQLLVHTIYVTSCQFSFKTTNLVFFHKSRGNIRRSLMLFKKSSIKSEPSHTIIKPLVSKSGILDLRVLPLI